MKKSVLQKVLTTALVGAMVVGTLTGCGNNSGNAGNDTTPSSENNNVSTDANNGGNDSVAGIAGYVPFENTVTLSIPVYDRGAEGVPAIGTGDNYWESWIQENFADQYNIEMKFVPITRSDVLTDYAMLAAGQSLPTILMEYDYPKQAQWAEDGYLTTYDLDEFAHVAPTYYQRMVDLGQLMYTEMGGERYFVLAERPYYNTDYTFITMYRKDWLDALGYTSYPTTWAEEKEMLQRLVDEGYCKYPLGGKMVKGAGVDQNFSYRTYPQDELTWATYGDYAIPALGSDAQKALLRRINEQYNLGFINPEYNTLGAEDEKANFVNGQAVQYSGYISTNMDWVTSFYEINPDGELAVKVSAATEDPEGGTVAAFRANNNFGMMISFSSQATEDEIKAAWMYMEWLTQEENLFTFQWGNEGEHFVYENGLPVAIEYTGSDKKQGYANNKDYWCVTIEARNAGTIEDMIKAASPVGETFTKDFSQEIIDNYYGQLAIAEKGRAVSDCNFSVGISAVADYQATLLDLYTVYRDQLTTCKPEEFDALYDKLAQEYKDAGYQAILDERQAAYEAGHSTKLPQ